jgi:hypothetical protein
MVLKHGHFFSLDAAVYSSWRHGCLENFGPGAAFGSEFDEMPKLPK